MIRATASALWRIEACPASASGTHVDETRADSDAGTEAHKEFERETPPDERAEVAVGLDMANGEAREVVTQGHRGYPDPRGWIFGTADRVRIEAERVVLIDFKSGSGYANTPAYAPAAKNLQLGFLALAFALAHNRPRAQVRIRRPEHEDEVADLDELDLAAMHERIRRLYARATEPEPKFVVGDGCWRCPRLRVCPAQTTLVRELAGGALAKVPTMELTPAAAAEAWRRLREAKRVLGVIEGALKAYASLGDVPLGDGRVLGERQTSRDSIDGAIAVKVLRSMECTTEQIDIAAEATVTKASLTRMIKANAPSGEAAAKLRRVLAAIAAEGGVTTTWSRKVDEHAAEETKP